MSGAFEYFEHEEEPETGDEEREESSDDTSEPHAEIDPGPFPVDALSQPMRQLVEEVADVHQVPVELPASAGLATLSGAMGKSFKLTGAVNGKETYGNIYVVPAAPKSTGKGASSMMTKPLIHASQKKARDFLEKELPSLKLEKELLTAERNNLKKKVVPGTKDYDKLTDLGLSEAKQRLLEIEQRLEQIEPLLEYSPTYWVGNATSEAMEGQFARNNDSLFCFSPEAGAVVRVMLGKYSKKDQADIDLHLSGYSVEPVRSDRVGRGITEIEPCLSTLLFCQPFVLRELISNEEALERGLTARILAFVVEPELKEDDGVVRTIDDAVQQCWEATIQAILDIREAQAGPESGPRIITCTPEAREVFRRFHNESIALRKGKYWDMEGELGRWRENALRLGLILCIADDPAATVLTEFQAERAVKITRWFVLSMLAIMNRGRMKRRYERLKELHSVLLNYPRREATLRDLRNRHCFDKEEVRSLVADFPDQLRVETRKPKTGRPSEVAFIPDLEK